ncbi:MAG: LysR family transcriptional regulator [Deltaproteobacteria bacterium]|nr:LysR family transcriptional regulator [Deltaproteobacteria bacterium]
MSLSSTQLDAFAAVARSLSFSKAAVELGITQSALSQRVHNLEEELGLTLFLRDRAGARLTPEGARLLRYCSSRETLEAELLSELVSRPGEGQLTGHLRVAAFSSILRSAVLPAVSPLLGEHPRIQARFYGRELSELAPMLARAEADFVFTSSPLERDGVESVFVGHETLVLVESASRKAPPDTYLDHDPEDTTTERFLKSHGRTTRGTRRVFLDDVYGLLDGARLGLGRAVVSRHLLAGTRGLRVVTRSAALKEPVYLHFHSQPHYTRLQLAARAALLTVASFL